MLRTPVFAIGPLPIASAYGTTWAGGRTMILARLRAGAQPPAMPARSKRTVRRAMLVADGRNVRRYCTGPMTVAKSERTC